MNFCIKGKKKVHKEGKKKQEEKKEETPKSGLGQERLCAAFQLTRSLPIVISYSRALKPYSIQFNENLESSEQLCKMLPGIF